MASNALGVTAEGLLGYWDGTGETPTPPSTAVIDRLQALQPDARAAAVAQEMSGFFTVNGTTEAPRVAGRTVTLTLPTPSAADLGTHQLPHLRAAMDLRADRLGEIVLQTGDMLSFFGSQIHLDNYARRWTLELLARCYDVVIQPEQAVKFAAAVPRPSAYSPKVQPMIQTPGHGSCPSGHATEAFAFATLLSLMWLKGRDPAQNAVRGLIDILTADAPSGAAEENVLMPFALAARIADNRTVAGVHFPIDSAYGGLLGFMLGISLARPALGDGFAHDFAPTAPFTDAPTSWNGGFTLEAWRDWLRALLPADLDAATVTGRRARLMGAIGTQALKEWG
ncbi:PAP2 superfamily protein [Roseivivax sp. THAF40]|nr:PAP2 superfamily protein [Roseivivax sp. THAF197b]QFT45533.1 PAP2 superfamily protein [Roseivivax sp. THAF40]